MSDFDQEKRSSLKRMFTLGLGAALYFGSRDLFAEEKEKSVSVKSTDDPRGKFWEEFWNRPRELWLTRPESGESGRFCYWQNNAITSDYKNLSWLLRDIHVDEAKDIDIRLLDLIFGVTGWLGCYGVNKPFVVNSGYRTNKTNSGLEGAAKNSMHLHGKAIDGRIDGISAEYLGRVFAAFKTGGVGFYVNRKYDFIHADVGEIRYWLRKK